MARLSRPIGAGLANFARSFTALRPLALLRTTRPGGLLAQWGMALTITRPWLGGPSHELWLGRVPRYEYRLRRMRAEADAGPRPGTRRVRIAGSDEWLPLAAPADADEGDSTSSAPEPDAEEAAAEPWIALDGLIEPLSVPHALAAPAAAGAEMGGATRTTLTGGPPEAAGMPAARRRVVLRAGEGASAAIRPEESVQGVAAEASVEQALAGAPAGEAYAVRHAAWPFQFLSPDAVRAATVGASGPGLTTPAFRAPAMLVRAVQRRAHSQAAQAMGGLETAFGTAAAPWAMAAEPTEMPRMRPVETMLTHVMLPAHEPSVSEETAEPSADARAGVRDLRRASRRPERLAGGEARTERRTAGGVTAGEVQGAEPIVSAEIPQLRRHAAMAGDEETAGGRAHSGPSERDSAVARAFPVIGLVRTAAKRLRGRAADEQAPAAMQVLRRFTPAQMQRALMGMAALPALGPGEALPAAVRRPMEVILQRSLTDVRTYTSAAAESVGAEAFTTGERIVFAPGRMNVRSTRGLALLAHELTHVGQPLAFKQSAGTDASDSAEQRAQAQESEVERIIEQGWPQAPRMDVRQAAHALSVLAQGESAGAGQRGGLQFEQRSLEGAGPSADGGGKAGPASAALPTARLSEVQPAAGAGPAGTQPDVEKLAREVYDILKSRLRAEKIRHTVY